MADHKLQQVNSNGTKQEYAGKKVSTGVADEGEFVTAGAGGKIDITFMPNGIAADAITVVAGEALAAGDFVYITSTGTAMKADASIIAKAARGYTLVSVTNGSQATIYFDESNSALSALTPGATYYLSTTPGSISTVAPTGSGNIVQPIGFATSATNVHVNIEEPVIRA